MIRWKPTFVQTLAAPRRGPRLARLRERIRAAYHHVFCRKCSSGEYAWISAEDDPHHHVPVANRRSRPPQPRDQRMELH